MENTIGQQFVIRSAIISSDRAGNDPLLANIEVSAILVELRLFEVIGQPYITGQVVFHDQSEMLRSLNLKGSERLTIKFEPASKNEVSSLERTFIIRGIPIVQDGESYLVDIIDERGYIATTKIINKSYTDKLPAIVSKLCSSFLNSPLVSLYRNLDTSQASTHVIIPSITVAGALSWLMDRYTNINGMPYFLTASLYLDRVIMFDMESSLSSTPFNIKTPFIKSQTLETYASGLEYEATPTSYTPILSYVEKHMDSIHELMQVGAVTVSYSLGNLNNNMVEEFVHSSLIPIDKLQRDGIIKYQDVLDTRFNIGGDNQVAVPCVDVTQMSSSSTYLPARSYSDDNSVAESRNKLSSNMLKKIMMQKKLSVKVPGALFAASRVCVGNKVRLLFESKEKLSDNKENLYDAKLSGDYMITHMVHTFTNMEYFIQLDGTKLAREYNV